MAVTGIDKQKKHPFAEKHDDEQCQNGIEDADDVAGFDALPNTVNFTRTDVLPAVCRHGNAHGIISAGEEHIEPAARCDAGDDRRAEGVNGCL